MIYRTDFRLTENVLNEDEARTYLLSDNMTRYLISDVKDPLLRDNIIGIKWILLTPRIGYVELTTEGILSEENRVRLEYKFYLREYMFKWNLCMLKVIGIWHTYANGIVRNSCEHQ